MTRLEETIDRLEALVVQAEARIRSLGEENARLRQAAAGTQPHGGEPVESRPQRLVLLEAERQDVRSRIRSMIQAL